MDVRREAGYSDVYKRREVPIPSPRVAFIGAGSTVFMKNIVGDFLQRPALAGSTIALMDIDARRLAESEIFARKTRLRSASPAKIEASSRPARARSTAPISSSSRFRSAATTLHDHRLRGSEEIRPEADDRRHARRRRYHARPTHRAAPVGGVRGHERALPPRDPAAARQPDGDQHLGDFGALSQHPPGRPVPFGAGHGDGACARSRHSDRKHPLPRRGHQSHGVLSRIRGARGGRVAGAISIPN